MPDQNQPKAPAFNPKLKDAIVALKAENNPKNLNAVLNELVRSPLLAPANFDLQGQSAPTPGPQAGGRWPRAAAPQHQNQPHHGQQPRGQTLLPGLQ